MSETYRDTDDPARALGDALVHNSRDWSADTCDAWLWGIVHGWSEEDEDGDGVSAMDDVAARHRWDAHDVARLRRLHASFQAIGTHREALGRVRDLHPRDTGDDGRESDLYDVCGNCLDTYEDPHPWPCPTIRAIKGDQT